MRPPMIAVFFTLGGAAFMAGCAGSPPVKPDRGGDAADALSRDAPHRDDARDSADAPENQVLDVSRDTPPDVEDVGDTSHEDGGAPREIRCNGRDDNGDGEIDEGGGCWRLIAEEGAPSGRIFHTLIATPDGRAVVWGGGTADDITATGGIYDPGCDCWTATNLEGAPRPRSSHAATWTNNTMLIVGGHNEVGAEGTCGRLDVASNVWIPTAPGPASWDNTVTWVPGVRQAIVWGSMDPEGVDPADKYDLDTNTWLSMSPDGAPLPRVGHASVLDATRGHVIIWGGAIPPDVRGSGGIIYDPAADIWIPVLAPGAPALDKGVCGQWAAPLDAMIMHGNTPRGFMGALNYETPQISQNMIY